MGPMNQHKKMAGAGDGGNFGVRSYDDVHGGKPHPDMTAGTGEKGAMGDGERAIAHPHVPRGKGMLPAQRAPDHGPHFEGELGIDRSDRKSSY